MRNRKLKFEARGNFGALERFHHRGEIVLARPGFYRGVELACARRAAGVGREVRIVREIAPAHRVREPLEDRIFA